MGIYLKAEDGPSISSPDYVGTFGSSQSRVILKLIRHYQTAVTDGRRDSTGYFEKLRNLQAMEKRRRLEYDDDGRTVHYAEWLTFIETNAPKDTYEFRKYVIDRGCDWLLNTKEYDDDHVKGVRDVITKIAEYGQDVYET